MRCVNYADCYVYTCRHLSSLFTVIAKMKKIRHVQSVHIVIRFSHSEERLVA